MSLRNIFLDLYVVFLLLILWCAFVTAVMYFAKWLYDTLKYIIGFVVRKF